MERTAHNLSKMIHIKLLNGEWKHYPNHQKNRLESLGYDVLDDYDFNHILSN